MVAHDQATQYTRNNNGRDKAPRAISTTASVARRPPACRKANIAQINVTAANVATAMLPRRILATLPICSPGKGIPPAMCTFRYIFAVQRHKKAKIKAEITAEPRAIQSSRSVRRSICFEVPVSADILSSPNKPPPLFYEKATRLPVLLHRPGAGAAKPATTQFGRSDRARRMFPPR